MPPKKAGVPKPKGIRKATLAKGNRVPVNPTYLSDRKPWMEELGAPGAKTGRETQADVKWKKSGRLQRIHSKQGDEEFKITRYPRGTGAPKQGPMILPGGVPARTNNPMRMSSNDMHLFYFQHPELRPPATEPPLTPAYSRALDQTINKRSGAHKRVLPIPRPAGEPAALHDIEERPFPSVAGMDYGTYNRAGHATRGTFF